MPYVYPTVSRLGWSLRVILLKTVLKTNQQTNKLRQISVVEIISIYTQPTWTVLTALVHVASPRLTEDIGDSDDAVTGDDGTSLLVFLAGVQSNNSATCWSPYEALSTACFNDT